MDEKMYYVSRCIDYIIENDTPIDMYLPKGFPAGELDTYSDDQIIMVAHLMHVTNIFETNFENLHNAPEINRDTCIDFWKVDEDNILFSDYEDCNHLNYEYDQCCHKKFAYGLKYSYSDVCSYNKGFSIYAPMEYVYKRFN